MSNKWQQWLDRLTGRVRCKCPACNQEVPVDQSKVDDAHVCGICGAAFVPVRHLATSQHRCSNPTGDSLRH